MLHINLKHNENVTDYQQRCQYPVMDMSPSNRADYENITEESNFLLICKMYKHMWEVFDEEMIEKLVVFQPDSDRSHVLLPNWWWIDCRHHRLWLTEEDTNGKYFLSSARYVSGLSVSLTNEDLYYGNAGTSTVSAAVRLCGKLDTVTVLPKLSALLLLHRIYMCIPRKPPPLVSSEVHLANCKVVR